MEDYYCDVEINEEKNLVKCCVKKMCYIKFFKFYL
mgnify:CR=1 FL=1